MGASVIGAANLDRKTFDHILTWRILNNAEAKSNFNDESAIGMEHQSIEESSSNTGS
jgi:hypothetical protein